MSEKKEWIKPDFVTVLMWLVVAFCFGFAANSGGKLADRIWPDIPIELNINAE
ncbi:hypothetical protein [Sulfurovum sp.]|uniref:hypothetical protein n=1 Tax=Sulfurovum sp. TaxID=1969726 RepID=UPI0035655FC4